MYLSGDCWIEVLCEVSFVILVGESVSICGELGLGKLMLLNLFVGLDVVDVGRIELVGSLVIDYVVWGWLIGIVF